jgi:di/tricarboxylate transporter
MPEMPNIEQIAGIPTQQVLLYAILVVAFGILFTERLRVDVVAILIVLSLVATRILTPEEALSGFSSEPAIILAAVFVLSQSLYQTGLSERAGELIGRLAGNSYARMVAVIMPAVGLLGAFTHHVTATAILLPITLNLARKSGVPASKLLMPMSFGASFGTGVVVIGAPAFLIARKVLEEGGRPGLGLFDIAPLGLTILATSTLFMVFIGRFLLPSHKGAESLAAPSGLKEYFTELAVLPGSPLVGKKVRDEDVSQRYRFDVVGLVRGGHHVAPPLEERHFREGDVVLAHTTPNQLASIKQEPGLELHPVRQFAEQLSDGGNGGHSGGEDGDEPLVQAVVAPGSDLVGKTLARVGFHRQYGAVVVGLWRRGEQLSGKLADIKLREGDVLVLQGDADTLARLRDQRRDFLMLVPFHGEPRARRKAPVAGLIMLGSIAAAVLGAPIELAMMAGAVAVVLTGCLSIRQAYNAIDQRIFVFIAGAIPLGKAMTKTGAAAAMAGGVQAVAGGWHQLLVLMTIFAIVALLTQLLSDSATVALLGPVAVSLAGGLGHAPEPYVITVAMAAVMAVLTPIGHHGNLLIYGPGRYSFMDFVKVGTPLTIMVGLLVTGMAPILWHG